MQHFVSQDKLNIFRLPVGWQYLVNNKLGGTLDPTFFATYDRLMQACLKTGAKCILDIHNYARWYGQSSISFLSRRLTTLASGMAGSLDKAGLPMSNSPLSGHNWLSITLPTQTLSLVS